MIILWSLRQRYMNNDLNCFVQRKQRSVCTLASGARGTGVLSLRQTTISSASEHASLRVICRDEYSASFFGSGLLVQGILFCCVLFGNLIITGVKNFRTKNALFGGFNRLTIATYTTSKSEFFI